MRISWWDYMSSDDTVHTHTTTTNRFPIWNKLLDHAHDLRFTYIPRVYMDEKTNKQVKYTDNGKFSRLWDPQGEEIQRAVYRTIIDTSNKYPMDKTNASLIAIKKLAEENPWPMKYDISVMRLFPMVSLNSRLQMVFHMLRCIVNKVPCGVIDGDGQFDLVRYALYNMIKLGDQGHGRKWSKDEIHSYIIALCPYHRKIKNWEGQQYYCFFPYNKSNELQYNSSFEPDYTFAYVGNDYQREGQLAHFYKWKLTTGYKLKNAIYGRWRLDRCDDKVPGFSKTVGTPAFKGKVGPNEVVETYYNSAATIMIAHPTCFKLGLVSQRWNEVIEAGRILFVNKKLGNLTGTVPNDQLVSTAEEAFDKLSTWIQNGEYEKRIRYQRNAVCSDPLFSLFNTVSAIESLWEDFSQKGRREIYLQEVKGWG